MNKSNWLSEEIIQELYYKQGLSALEIGRKFGHGYSQIYKFMRRHQMPRRACYQTHRLQFLRSPLSYSKVNHLTPALKKLWVAGLMLYWAEGAKAQPEKIDFANSDPKMCVLFLRMLREIYQINESRLRCFLYCYSNQDPLQLMYFWSNLLSIPTSKFFQPYIRHDFNVNKVGKMSKGLVHVVYSDSRLLSQIKADIDIISSQLCRDGRADNYTTL